MFTDPAGIWNLTGNSELTSLTQDAGTVNFPKPASASAFTGTTLTIDGDYSADGGTVNMNTVLDGDNSAHDLLLVKGSATGTATLIFNKVSGSGAQTALGSKWWKWTGSQTRCSRNRIRIGSPPALISTRLRKSGATGTSQANGTRTLRIQSYRIRRIPRYTRHFRYPGHSGSAGHSAD